MIDANVLEKRYLAMLYKAVADYMPEPTCPFDRTRTERMNTAADQHARVFCPACGRTFFAASRLTPNHLTKESWT